MELDQLRYFLRVAARKNFTRAAEELGISQPALSRSIARLEEELKRPLFERQTRTVTLTDAGKLLHTRAEQILGLVENAAAEITDDGQTGRIRLGAIPTIAPFFLPPLLRSFATAHPRAALSVAEEVTDKLLQRVLQGEVDLAFLALPLSKQYLQVETLFEEELRLVLPIDHPLASKKAVTLADVQSQPFILLDDAHCLSTNIASFCRRLSLQPIAMERTSQLATVQELVALGHGVSLMPEMACTLDQSTRRVYRRLAGPKPTRTIAMVWNPYRFQSRLAERFKTHTREFVASRPAAGEPSS